MKIHLALWALLAATGLGAASDSDITWLVRYEGKSLPQEQGWRPVGGLAPRASLVDGALRIVDDSATDAGSFRATWKPDPNCEVIVEARVRVESIKAGPKGGTSFWPAVEGAPVGLLVSDGRRQEGLVLRPEKIATFLDRVVPMDAKREFHTYRLVMRGNNMSVSVDGVLKIRGEGAFWKPTETPEAFVQFGSNSPQWIGDGYWSSVKLGLRKVSSAPEKPKLRITLSEPWDIPPTKTENSAYKFITPHTRPFLHDMGRGLLLMSVAQGPDAVLEPYGVLKSTDEGKTWQPVSGLQAKSFAPQSILRLPDGDILAISRWTAKYDREDGVYIGMSYRFDPKAERYKMFESLVRVPEGMGAWLCFSRDMFNIGSGEILASVYGAAKTGRRAMLLKSADGGATWTHHSTLGPRPEPSVVRFSDQEMMALLRVNGWMPFEQIWSRDGGKTWTPPITLEEGSVDPDLVYMSNGVVACSYGRPGSNLMFSTDKGKTWGNHHVITGKKGYNYTAIREVRPGRLLYVQDSPRMQALYIDVERLN
ncbi:MAG: exo-alpha-sialidase [Verrucomicrobia bacterium]|nr:exo-alpha-sialidase [Verrucomicrobiota bacterium]